jgi:hypothetical protein
METELVPNEDRAPRFEVPAGQIGAAPRLARRIGARLLHELREALPPTIFFFVGFNFIVLTTNLLVAAYAVAVSNFMLATLAALVVGKAVLTANAMPFLKVFDRAPLIQPILFKTVIYWVAVFLARLMEHFVRFSLIEGHWPGDFGAYLITSFSWQRFVAISLWIFVLFLTYVTASEFSQLLGPAEMRRLLFTYRPSKLQLNRRQRTRELLRLSRLADERSVDEFRDTTSTAHHELIEIVQRLARTSRLKV